MEGSAQENQPPRRKTSPRAGKPAPAQENQPFGLGGNGSGRVPDASRRFPDASHTIEFEETDTSRTRPQPFLPAIQGSAGARRRCPCLQRVPRGEGGGLDAAAVERGSGGGGGGGEHRTGGRGREQPRGAGAHFSRARAVPHARTHTRTRAAGAAGRTTPAFTLLSSLRGHPPPPLRSAPCPRPPLHFLSHFLFHVLLTHSMLDS
eukprot:gene4639-biopygen8456